MKKYWTTLLLILVFVTGLSLLLYPTISDVWNSLHQSRAIAGYTDSVAQLDENDYAQVWQEAWASTTRPSPGMTDGTPFRTASGRNTTAY